MVEPASPRPWSRDDLLALRLHYGTASDEALGVLLERPIEEVEAKAAELALAKDKGAFPGLRKMPRWTDEEVDRLRELYPDRPNLEIAHELGRSLKSVVSKACNLGLRKDLERLQAMGRENQALRRRRGAPRPSERPRKGKG